MRLKLLMACLACSGLTSLRASDLPTPGQDYYSLQIASSKDMQAMQTLYQRYAELPFVRLERRGTLYVLRAGFWDSSSSARLALSKVRLEPSLIRIAAYRPETMVAQNWLQETTLPSPAIAAAQRKPEPAIAPQTSDALHPFNQEDFVLAYGALLAGKDSARAFQVAQKAVQQVPQDRQWRRRLAQAAEWTQRPLVAAQQWRTLFDTGDHSPEIVSAVIRLAYYMDDPAIVLKAWQARDKQTVLTAVQWQDVYSLYESAAQPSQGSLFFEQQFKQKKTLKMLEYAAQLAENAGEDERATALYLQRAGLEPFSLDMVLRAAVALIRQDRMRDALELMHRHQAQVPADAAEFWGLLGQVAWEQGAFESAQGAYQNLVKRPLTAADDWSRLIFLVRQKHPAQAAGLALEAYRRVNAKEQLIQALEIYAELHDLQALARTFESLDAKTLAWAQQNTRFLLIRAEFHKRQKLPHLAWTDLRSALKLAPRQADIVVAFLWFLIDEARTNELSNALQKYGARSADDPAYWLPFAVANQLLERHSEAVRWYDKEVQRNPTDALMLLNYADALERSQREGLAERVRRHAWLTLKKKYPQTVELQNLSKREELVALVRLALSNQPGDPGLQGVRQLAQQLRGASNEPGDDEQTKVLVLGWAIVQEQHANARDWMWLRYVRHSQSAPPLWGEAQTALELKDTTTLSRLLRHNADGLPIYNRYDTAYTLGHAPQALEIAFHGMTAQGDDEPLHDRFRQHAPLHAHYLQLRASNEQFGAFEQQDLRLGSLARKGLQWEARWVAAPQLHITLGWSQLGQSSEDGNFAANPSSSDRLNSVQAKWLGSRGDSTVTLFQSYEWQRYTGLQLNQTLQWGGRLNLEAGLNYRTESSATTPLQVFGYENSLQASATYTLGKREYLRAAPRLTRYYTQLHDYLGSGRLLDLEAGYRIRTEYPDWRLRAYYTYQDFSTDGALSITASPLLAANSPIPIADPVAYLMPVGASTLGACVGMGENLGGQNLPTVYSRAWRPFLDFCLSHNGEGSNGYSGLLGLAGSLTGEDHLSVQLQNNGSQVPGSPVTRSMAIRYRHYF
jgi:predicted Zn-dependent protease